MRQHSAQRSRRARQRRASPRRRGLAAPPALLYLRDADVSDLATHGQLTRAQLPQHCGGRGGGRECWQRQREGGVTQLLVTQLAQPGKQEALPCH